MANRVVFVCTIALAAVYLYGATKIPKVEIGDPLGPKAFPYLLGIALLIAAGLLFLEIRREKKKRDPAETATATESRRHLLVITGVVTWTCLYLAVFEALGYLITTAIYLFMLMAYFNPRKHTANAFAAVLFCAGTYLLFDLVLGLPLPKGLLGF